MLLKKIKDGLNRRYEPPAWGFVASKKYFELGEASVTVRPAAGPSEVIVVTTVRTETAFLGHNYTSGWTKRWRSSKRLSKATSEITQGTRNDGIAIEFDGGLSSSKSWSLFSSVRSAGDSSTTPFLAQASN